MTDTVEEPSHYTWLGRAVAAGGVARLEDMEVWDVLDAAFDSPLLWAAGKYILRAGRKDASRKLEDVRKAHAFLGRYIKKESRRVAEGQS